MLVVDSYITLESNNKVITAVILLKLHLNMNGNHAYNLILVNFGCVGVHVQFKNFARAIDKSGC